MRLALALLLAFPAALWGCVVDEAANPARGCEHDSDCDDGRVCHRGFCVVEGEPDASTPMDSGPGVMDSGGDSAAADSSAADSSAADAGGESDAGDGPDAGSCSEGATESCYGGPEGTLGVGGCEAGERSCTSGSWGPCVGEVLPVAEECNEADDDCDGSTDEDFSFDDDTLHCGGCGTVCADGWQCCSGACIDPQMDKDNCGGCDNRCAPPTRNCCSGTCGMSC